jgi:hypothetical protein
MSDCRPRVRSQILTIAPVLRRTVHLVQIRFHWIQVDGPRKVAVASAKLGSGAKAIHATAARIGLLLTGTIPA